MERVYLNGKMALIIKEIIKTKKSMVLENMLIGREKVFKGFGDKELGTDRELSQMRVVKFLKGDGPMVISFDSFNFHLFLLKI